MLENHHFRAARNAVQPVLVVTTLRTAVHYMKYIGGRFFWHT